jgi:acyl-CoA synthetase (AMP-forming)/AMP-acid ligase II
MSQIDTTTPLEGVLPDPTVDLHWNEYRGAIHEIFAANAAKHPERPCVIETPSATSSERSFTYQQIHEASNQLAHHFLANGCEVGDVVMVYAHRCVDLVVAYMGALKAGAAVSVLDPLYPADRQIIYLDVGRPRFLVHIERAVEHAGKIADKVRSFIDETLDLKAEVPALKLRDDGTLAGGQVGGKDCLEEQEKLKTVMPDVQVGPDSGEHLCNWALQPKSFGCGMLIWMNAKSPRSRIPVEQKESPSPSLAGIFRSAITSLLWRSSSTCLKTTNLLCCPALHTVSHKKHFKPCG